MSSPTPEPIIELDGITKRFGGVKALDDVSFSIARGEIHAVVGENGAGKSTLMKMLAGVHTPDAGTIALRGQPVSIGDPLAARKLGISIVFLEMMGVPIDPREKVGKLSVGEKQLVEIARTLQQRSEIVIMDEPNSALNASESERLFAILRRLRDRGLTIIYVSHRLEEVFAIADRISVIRDG